MAPGILIFVRFGACGAIGPRLRSAPALSGLAAQPETASRTPSCWGLSIGVAGMLSQMRGVAQSAGFRFEPKELGSSGAGTGCRCSLVPTRLSVVRDADTLDARLPPPLIIACGRHSVIRHVPRGTLGAGDLRACSSRTRSSIRPIFDLVIAAEHDGVTGDNVVNTRGPASRHAELLAAASRRQRRTTVAAARPARSSRCCWAGTEPLLQASAAPTSRG